MHSYLGSFSKTFAPGLRVGWVLAPHAVREKLVLAAEAAVLCPPQLNQMVVAEYLSTQDWQEQVERVPRLYRERRDAMLDALAPDARRHDWTHPTGGFYVWVTLPGDLDAKVLLPARGHRRASRSCPAPRSTPTSTGRSNLRLSYCFPEPERIREGVRRLGGVLEEEVELRATFGSDRLDPSRTGRRPKRPRPDMD